MHEARRTRLRRSRPARRSLAPILQTSGDSRAALPFNDAVARFEQELLIDALQHAHGNMLQAARDLQVSYRIVNYKVKKYNIDPRSFA